MRQGHACRMASLVAHFGDTADSRHLCGHCDFCSPERAIAQSFRGLTAQEEQAARGILKSLRGGPSPSTGRLYKELYPREDLSRNDFDDVLGALAAAGLVRIEEASFEKDGKPVNYRKARSRARARSSPRAPRWTSRCASAPRATRRSAQAGEGLKECRGEGHPSPSRPKAPRSNSGSRNGGWPSRRRKASPPSSSSATACCAPSRTRGRPTSPRSPPFTESAQPSSNASAPMSAVSALNLR